MNKVIATACMALDDARSTLQDVYDVLDDVDYMNKVDNFITCLGDMERYLEGIKETNAK